jgi:hypothetical protein
MCFSFPCTCVNHFIHFFRFGKALIKITFIASIVLYFAFGALFAVQKNWIGAIIYFLLGGLSILCYMLWRSRFALSALIMETVCTIMNKYPGAYVAATLNLFLQLAYSIWWSFTVIGAAARWNNTNVMNLILIYLVFSMYWTSQIIRNTLHVTICGVTASYYFLEGMMNFFTNT